MVPLIIEQLLAILVGMADSIMVSSVGEAAVSGVSLVDTIFILLINIFAALATGGAVVSGQYIGKRRPEEGCKAADQQIEIAVSHNIRLNFTKDYMEDERLAHIHRCHNHHRQDNCK